MVSAKFLLKIRGWRKVCDTKQVAKHIVKPCSIEVSRQLTRLGVPPDKQTWLMISGDLEADLPVLERSDLIAHTLKLIEQSH